MPKRTTIEIDEQLLARAKRALGTSTTRQTVEEALRTAADRAEVHRAEQAAAQIRYLQALAKRGDSAALAADEMWR